MNDFDSIPLIERADERESLAFGFPLRGTGKPNKGIHQCARKVNCREAAREAGLGRWFMQATYVACVHDSIPLIRSTKKDRREAVIFVERMRGIEPPLSAWEAGVLPMNYIRVYGKYSTERKKNQSLFRRFFSAGSAEEQRRDKIV